MHSVSGWLLIIVCHIASFHSIILFQATRPIQMKQKLDKKTENHAHTHARTHAHTHTHSKTSLDFTEARDSEWQWHLLGHMQVSTSLQSENHASTPLLSFFTGPDALPAAQPTLSKH